MASEGENLGIAFDANDGHLFRADGMAFERSGPTSGTPPLSS
ncbi:MAG: hypothetical protein AAGB11_20065 [Pseudomonadota bacterium]